MSLVPSVRNVKLDTKDSPTVTVSGTFCKKKVNFEISNDFLSETKALKLVACDCSPSGALDCNYLTRKCSCKKGYFGTKCESACNCSTSGSASSTCDATTGKCACKTNYIGNKCSECKSGYFKDASGACVDKGMNQNTFTYIRQLDM